MTPEGKTRIQVTLGNETLQKLSETARGLGISKSAAITMALHGWFKTVENQRAAAR